MASKYRFKNNGRPVKIKIGGFFSPKRIVVSVGSLVLERKNILSFAVNEKADTKGILFKKTKTLYYLVIRYLTVGNHEKQLVVQLGGTEYKKGLEAYAKAQPILRHFSGAAKHGVYDAPIDDTFADACVTSNDGGLFDSLFDSSGEDAHICADENCDCGNSDCDCSDD